MKFNNRKGYSADTLGSYIPQFRELAKAAWEGTRHDGRWGTAYARAAPDIRSSGECLPRAGFWLLRAPPGAAATSAVTSLRAIRALSNAAGRASSFRFRLRQRSPITAHMSARCLCRMAMLAIYVQPRTQNLLARRPRSGQGNDPGKLQAVCRRPTASRLLGTGACQRRCRRLLIS